MLRWCLQEAEHDPVLGHEKEPELPQHRHRQTGRQYDRSISQSSRSMTSVPRCSQSSSTRVAAAGLSSHLYEDAGGEAGVDPQPDGQHVLVGHLHQEQVHLLLARRLHQSTGSQARGEGMGCGPPSWPSCAGVGLTWLTPMSRKTAHVHDTKYSSTASQLRRHQAGGKKGSNNVSQFWSFKDHSQVHSTGHRSGVGASGADLST